MSHMHVNVAVDFDSRFTKQEVIFHLRRALEDYLSLLVDDDDDDGIKIMDISETSKVTNVDADRLFGGNS